MGVYASSAPLRQTVPARLRGDRRDIWLLPASTARTHAKELRSKYEDVRWEQQSVIARLFGDCSKTNARSHCQHREEVQPHVATKKVRQRRPKRVDAPE